MNAFVNELQAQKGKAVNEEAYTLLVCQRSMAHLEAKPNELGGKAQIPGLRCKSEVELER